MKSVENACQGNRWILVLAMLFIDTIAAVLNRVEIHEDDLSLCLDGTKFAYGLRKGFDKGKNHWIIHLQGGAWCGTEVECRNRRDTPLGTSCCWSYLQETAGVSIFLYLHIQTFQQ